MVPKIRIGCNEHGVTLLLRRVEEIAIRKRRPTALIGGSDFMLRQEMTQWLGSALIEQDAHLSGS